MDPVTLGMANLNTKKLLRQYGGMVVALGDSITNNYGSGQSQTGTTSYQPDNHYSLALALAGQSPLWLGAFSAGGYTLEQIRDTFVPQVLAMTPVPAAALILGGTNNAGAASGVGFVTSAAIAVVQQICQSLATKAIVPILATIPPRGDNTTVNQNVDKFNRALKRFAAVNGYDLIDYHRVLVDPSTGVYKAGYCQTDNIHPSFKGCKAMAQAAAPFWASRFPRSVPPIADHKLDTSNLISSGAGLFVADSDADGLSNGWASFSGTGMTFSRVLDPDGLTYWQRITMGTAGSGNALLQWSNTGLCAAGDVIELCARIQTNGFEAATVDPSTGGSGGTGPSWYLTAAIPPGNSGNDVMAPAYSIHTDVTDGVVYGRFPAPAGATGQIKVNLQVAGHPAVGTVWVQYANIALRNLTALGIA